MASGQAFHWFHSGSAVLFKKANLGGVSPAQLRVGFQGDLQPGLLLTHDGSSGVDAGGPSAGFITLSARPALIPSPHASLWCKVSISEAPSTRRLPPHLAAPPSTAQGRLPGASKHKRGGPTEPSAAALAPPSRRRRVPPPPASVTFVYCSSSGDVCASQQVQGFRCPLSCCCMPCRGFTGLQQHLLSTHHYLQYFFLEGAAEGPRVWVRCKLGAHYLQQELPLWVWSDCDALLCSLWSCCAVRFRAVVPLHPHPPRPAWLTTLPAASLLLQRFTT